MDKIIQLEDLKPVKERFCMAGKKAIVTGAAGGIGRSTAAALAELGADVALVDVRTDQAEKYAEFIERKYKVHAAAVACDVTKEEEVNAMVEAVVKTFGTIDIVHSNAGAIGAGYDDGDIDFLSWRRLMAINLDGMFLVNQKVCQYLRQEKKGGAIVNTASISGHVINRTQGRHSVCYPAAKAGVLHLTKGMAADFCQYGIRINSVSPGNMLSGIHAGIPDAAMESMTGDCVMKRLGSMDEIGGVVAFLLSDLATYITGADVLVDGGYCIW
ncbi:SDR family NAD(P)-dependent oxidoreductase [Luxibacter massiliensis]|uniref:SDR family NAD(P)-dependent oxidoreductase n=1 Tax=Luxibacter massiliensis TaxID=2219695 RepID=UPI0013DFB8F9|nr:SDR family oxidoreductase [Luxibacter massiliensis]